MNIRPKIFLDTDIVNKAADGRISADEWQRVRNYIVDNYDYCMSFTTMKEMLSGVARGDETRFEQNKRRVQLYCDFDKRTFLPYPAVFVARVILGLDISRKGIYVNLRDEEWAELVLEMVLNAPSKSELKKGIPARRSVDSTTKDTILAFDLDLFDQHENSPQNEHADLLAGLRNGTTHISAPLEWARLSMIDFGIHPTAEQSSKLLAALDAAYHYSLALYDLSKDPKYDYSEHATDWGDAMQLYYLCDQSMHFLTQDRRCKDRTKNSTQASRILLYPEFVQSMPKVSVGAAASAHGAAS